MTSHALVLFTSLISPLFILVLEKLWPYPYIIEEAAKLLIVVQLLKCEIPNHKFTLKWAIVCGVLFAVSEASLFTLNIWTLGTPALLIQKVAVLLALHVGTVVLMYVAGRKSHYLLVVALCLAILVHFAVNTLLG